MDQPPLNPGPDHETTWTLYRFCLSRGLALNDHQRSAVGVELSQLARERQLSFTKVRERVGPGQWSKSRLYPESFLREWLARYTQAQAQPTPAPKRSAKPRPGAHG